MEMDLGLGFRAGNVSLTDLPNAPEASWLNSNYTLGFGVSGV